MTPENPRVSANDWYRGASGRHYHLQKRGIPEVALPWVIRCRARRFESAVGPGDSVFEYGVGAGWNLGGLQCLRRVGFDIADSVAEGVRKLGMEFVSDTRGLPSHSFDVAICHHALEHVPDPLASLSEIGRLLKANGRLLLAVPYERERRYRHFDADEPNHHLFSWNAQTLGNLLQLAGYRFVNIALRRYGYDRVAAVWAVKLRLGESGFRFIRFFLQQVRPCHEVTVVASPN